MEGQTEKLPSIKDNLGLKITLGGILGLVLNGKEVMQLAGPIW